MKFFVVFLAFIEVVLCGDLAGLHTNGHGLPILGGALGVHASRGIGLGSGYAYLTGVGGHHPTAVLRGHHAGHGYSGYASPVNEYYNGYGGTYFRKPKVNAHVHLHGNGVGLSQTHGLNYGLQAGGPALTKSIVKAVSHNAYASPAIPIKSAIKVAAPAPVIASYAHIPVAAPAPVAAYHSPIPVGAYGYGGHGPSEISITPSISYGYSYKLVPESVLLHPQGISGGHGVGVLNNYAGTYGHGYHANIGKGIGRGIIHGLGHGIASAHGLGHGITGAHGLGHGIAGAHGLGHGIAGAHGLGHGIAGAHGLGHGIASAHGLGHGIGYGLVRGNGHQGYGHAHASALY